MSSQTPNIVAMLTQGLLSQVLELTPQVPAPYLIVMQFPVSFETMHNRINMLLQGRIPPPVPKATGWYESWENLLRTAPEFETVLRGAHEGEVVVLAQTDEGEGRGYMHFFYYLEGAPLRAYESTEVVDPLVSLRVVSAKPGRGKSN